MPSNSVNKRIGKGFVCLIFKDQLIGNIRVSLDGDGVIHYVLLELVAQLAFVDGRRIMSVEVGINRLLINLQKNIYLFE